MEHIVDEFVKCDFMTNPGTWPYAKRCTNNATVRYVEREDSIPVLVERCDEHNYSGE